MNMKLLFEKLEAVGESFSERWMVAMLLSSLPSSYDTLVTALEARKMDELTLNVVETCLIEESQRNTSEMPVNSVLKSSNHDGRNVKKCHFCKAMGHIKRDCWKFKKLKNNQQANKVESSNGNEKTNYCF